MKRILGTAVAAMALFTAVSARAEDDAWHFKLTPYAWAMGLDGDVGVHGLKAPVDVSFSDALKDLDLAGMLAAEANNGTWGVLFDGTYVKLSGTDSTSVGTLRAGVEQWMLQGAVVYRVVQSEKTRTLVDAGLGGRFMDVYTDISGPVHLASDSESWVDPILVARVRQQFTQNFFGVLTGDIGGFGSASELTWEATASAGYSFNRTISLLLGYRYLDYDYEHRGFTYDAAAGGLVLGLQFNL